MDLSTIQDYKKMGIGEVISMYLKEAWYFNAWYEKLILILMGVLAVWKIYGFIF